MVWSTLFTKFSGGFAHTVVGNNMRNILESHVRSGSYYHVTHLRLDKTSSDHPVSSLGARLGTITLFFVREDSAHSVFV